MAKEERDSLFHEMVNSSAFDELIRLARSCVEGSIHSLRYAPQMENSERQVHLAKIKSLREFLDKVYGRAGVPTPKSIEELFR